MLRRISISQNITYRSLSIFTAGAYRAIWDVINDLSAVLYVYQEVGEYFVDRQNSPANGVFLIEYPGMTSRRIMPEGYFYRSVRFANNGRMIMAYRFGEGLAGAQLVICDMEIGEFHVVLAIEPDGISFGNLQILNGSWLEQRIFF